VRRILFGAVLLAAAMTAKAQSVSLVCVGFTPTLQVNAAMGADAGQPGLFWLALGSQGLSVADYVDLNGQWESYQGGLFPPTVRYDAGLPTAVQMSVPLPGSPTNTSNFIGWIVGVGEGILTPASQQLVAQRRQSLNSAKAVEVAAGGWDASYDSDDQYKLALIQTDMQSNKKYQQALTIPFLDCNPNQGGGGSGGGQ
jgi:hypothetical protein